jgi:transcriptional regulator with GAF, ATPase, and Fis domain
MPQQVFQEQDKQSEPALTDLGALLLVSRSVEAEQDIARLVATGLPAILPCRLSGVALRQEPGAPWQGVLQQAGQPAAPLEAAAMSTALERLLAVAMAQGTLLFTPHAHHPHASLLRPLAETWRLPWLAVIPLLTWQRPLGLLLVGYDRPAGFSKYDACLLHTLAAHLAGTLAQCRRQQQLYHRSQELERLVATRTAEGHLAQEHCRHLAAERAALTRLAEENSYLQEELKTAHHFDEIIGTSRPLRAMLKLVEVVAPTETTVLLLGETGTGKELVARALHAHSPRRQRPLVKVNCAALPVCSLSTYPSPI